MTSNIKMWFEIGMSLGTLQHSWNADKSMYPENDVTEVDNLLENLTLRAKRVSHPTRKLIHYFIDRMFEILVVIEEIEEKCTIEK